MSSLNYPALTRYSFQVSCGYLESALHLDHIIEKAIIDKLIKEVGDTHSFHSWRISSLDSLHNSFEQALRSMIYLEEGVTSYSPLKATNHDLVKLLDLLSDKSKYDAEVEKVLRVLCQNLYKMGHNVICHCDSPDEAYEGIFKSKMELEKVCGHLAGIYERNGKLNLRYIYERASDNEPLCLITTPEFWITSLILLAFLYVHKGKIEERYDDFEARSERLVYINGWFNLCEDGFNPNPKVEVYKPDLFLPEYVVGNLIQK